MKNEELRAYIDPRVETSETETEMKIKMEMETETETQRNVAC